MALTSRCGNSVENPVNIYAHFSTAKRALLLSSLTTSISTKLPTAHHENSRQLPKHPSKTAQNNQKSASTTIQLFSAISPLKKSPLPPITNLKPPEPPQK
jgi:hypothetical protein